MRLFSTIALLSICAYSVYAIAHLYLLRTRPITSQTTTPNDQTTLLPSHIKISSAKIDVGIYPSTYKDNTWEYTDDGVSYLTNTPLPGSAGNSVLYGHNRPNILSNLKNLQKGDLIEINYTDGSKQNFVVSNAFAVTADQTHILNNTNDTRITIYTCYGFLDSKRWVVVASKV